MLDISNYVPAGTSYDKYLTTYLGGCKCEDKIRCVCGLGKGIFPYEYITSYGVLSQTTIPPKSAFDSKLRGTSITRDEYERVKFVWGYYGMKSIKDLLIWYNNLDVVPCIKAIKSQRELFMRFDLDMFSDGVSLPGLSEKVMYQTCFNNLQYPDKKPANAFHFPAKRMSGYKIQDDKAKRKFGMTLDHLNILLQKQKYLCGLCYCQLTKETASADRINNKLGHIDGNILVSCIKCNTARKDMSLRGFRYKKLLEFNSDRLVYSIDKEEKDIYAKMKANIAGGPSIIFNRYAKRNETKIRGGIVEDIVTDKIFGFLECDIRTPDHLKDYFSEMTPIFENTLIDCTDESVIGHHMYAYNETRKKSRAKPARKLIGSYFGEKILVYAPLLKWYLDHGMVITKTYSFIKASSHKPFESFMGQVSDARREGDVNKAIDFLNSLKKTVSKWRLKDDEDDVKKYFEELSYHQISTEMVISKSKDYGFQSDDLKRLIKEVSDVHEFAKSNSMIAEMMKLVGNSAFGRSGMDMSKHKVVNYESNDEAIKRKIEHFTFHGLEELNGSCEITMKKRRLNNKNPIHLSIAIYQLAKLRMLQFYYDCIDFYFDRSDFQYQEMDTDSGYIAFSCENPFRDCIKSELCDHFDEHKYEWFPRGYNMEVAAFDRRTPGLFKEEWRGDAMVSLSSKNYICYLPDEEHKVKVSAKGIQQGRGRNTDVLSPKGFETIVQDRITLQGTNKGFRLSKETKSIITYKQSKTALSYYFDKRQVLSDGISTIPLNI
ncbi:hypothetical protein Plhal304r1_c051g0134091 [Plasmopara halstedii]